MNKHLMPVKARVKSHITVVLLIKQALFGVLLCKYCDIARYITLA